MIRRRAGRVNLSNRYHLRTTPADLRLPPWRALGQPTGRWAPQCLAVAIRMAVVNRGWPPADIVTALLAMAADKVRYTHDEYATIAGAARDTGLTPTGYVAETALATAQGNQIPSTAPWRTALLELIEARTQVRRIGVNINQAAAAINATGEPPPWLRHALAITNKAVRRLDEAATAVTNVARHDRARTRTRG